MFKFLTIILCHLAITYCTVFYTCIDVNVDKPDEKSIMTYVAQFLKYYPDPHHTVADVQENDVSFSCILTEIGLSQGVLPKHIL